MKKSEFITKILKDKENTVFVSKEQVENAILCFQRAGMLPPKSLDTVTLKKKLVAGYTMMFEWEEEMADEIEWTKQRLFKLDPELEAQFKEAFGEDHSIKDI